MLDFGAGELVVIGVVALVAIGPKELPGVLRAVGKSVGKMRRMAGEFQNQFSDAMREMELEEARKKVEEMGKQVSDSVAEATKDSASHIDSYLAEHASVTPAADPQTAEADHSTPTTHPDVPSAPDLPPVSSDVIMGKAEVLAGTVDTTATSHAPSEAQTVHVADQAAVAPAVDAAPVSKSAS